VRDLHNRLLPAIDVVWVDEQTHARALSALLAAGRISFVDWVSFEVMRLLGIDTAFAFDRDFVRQGFALVP
jgi:predicted nucleic acid-binding protein